VGYYSESKTNIKRVGVPHHVAMSMHHNYHTTIKASIEQAISMQLDGYADDDWISEEQKQRSINSNNHWSIIAWPEHSSIYYVYSACDIAVLLEHISNLAEWGDKHG
jgi:hypothetical protein